jgi:hypothetical protein
MPTPTLSRLSTTEMEVTSIRLERELKEELKKIAGGQGYQALIRDVLWDYVQQKSGSFEPRINADAIRATLVAQAQSEERCALTGEVIKPNQKMLLGFTDRGNLVPLSSSSLKV